MSNSSKLHAIEIEAETAFGENVSTFATFRIPLKAPLDLSGLKQNKADSGAVQQYRQGGQAYVPMTFSGTFKTRMDWVGHGSTCAGAVSLTPLETLLGNILGNATVSASSGTTCTGGTASVPLTTASGTFAAGSLCRIGARGDGRGNGQILAIGTHVTTTLTLLTAADGAPNAADVLYSGVNIYPSELPTSTTAQSYRMRYLSANLRYELHGCFPTALTLAGLNHGDKPYWEVTWTTAWAQPSTATFPSVVATDTSIASPINSGSLFYQTAGTVTRNKLTHRNFTLNYKLGMEVLKGPGGVVQYQDIVGCRRTIDEISISFMIDADTATTTPVLDTDWLSSNAKHVLWTGSCQDGSAIGVYAPNAFIMGDRPFQRIDQNINRYGITLDCSTGTTTTNDLTLSAIRLYNG